MNIRSFFLLSLFVACGLSFSYISGMYGEPGGYGRYPYGMGNMGMSGYGGYGGQGLFDGYGF